MVKVIYDGNLGNWLFQYCFGRLLAQRLGYRLEAQPIPGIRRTYERIVGADYSSREPKVLRGQKPDLSFLDNPGKWHLLLTGYFQRSEYYLPHRPQIKEWLAIDDDITPDVTPADVVVSMRRGRDYIPHYGLPLSYYEEAISSLGFDRLFICTNEPNDPFVQHFQRKHGAIVRAGSFSGGRVRPGYLAGALDNLSFIEKFDKIVMSNSSFAWWGAFLSDASQIVGPRPASGMWAEADPVSRSMNLEVRERRYRFIDCQAYTSPFILESLRNHAEAAVKSTKDRAARAFPFLRRGLKEEKPAFVFREEDE